MKVADYDVQVAAKFAQLSKAYNALLGSKLSEAKQKWRFDRMVAEMLQFEMIQRCGTEETDYRNGLSFVQLVDLWRSSKSRFLRYAFFEGLIEGLYIASVVCLFAETDELQSVLLHIFGQYRRLLVLYKFKNNDSRQQSPPVLFAETYRGRRVSSMRGTMFSRHFKYQLGMAKMVLRHYDLFPYGPGDFLDDRFEGFVEDFMVVVRETKVDHIEYLMRCVTMLTLSRVNNSMLAWSRDKIRY